MIESLDWWINEPGSNMYLCTEICDLFFTSLILFDNLQYKNNEAVVFGNQKSNEGASSKG